MHFMRDRSLGSASPLYFARDRFFGNPDPVNLRGSAALGARALRNLRVIVAVGARILVVCESQEIWAQLPALALEIIRLCNSASKRKRHRRPQNRYASIPLGTLPPLPSGPSNSQMPIVA